MSQIFLKYKTAYERVGMQKSSQKMKYSLKSTLFKTDIQEMMFGLGDCPKPLEETAKVIEEIVLEQLNAILHQAEEVSNRRSAKVISPQDLLFLMRKNVLKLQRLISYLCKLLS